MEVCALGHCRESFLAHACGCLELRIANSEAAIAAESRACVNVIYGNAVDGHPHNPPDIEYARGRRVQEPLVFAAFAAAFAACLLARTLARDAGSTMSATDK